MILKQKRVMVWDMKHTASNKPGRRSKGPREVLTVRYDAKLRPRLEEVARVQNKPMSEIVAEAMKQWLPDIERQLGLRQVEELQLGLEDET